MAFQLRRERSYPLAKTHRGERTRARFSFSFPNLPLVDEAGRIDDFIRLGTHFGSGVRDRLLSYTVEEDTGPRPNKFRVTVYTAGTPDREVSGTIEKGRVSVSGAAGVDGVGPCPSWPSWVSGSPSPSSS